MEMARQKGPPVQAQLGLWDTVGIIAGIVIGATIFRSPQLIMSNVSSPLWGLGAWALGGLLSLFGAFCYAELASAYPRLGGDYVYLTRAYGPWAGFLFGWAQLAVVQTASIGVMAFIFADYGVELWNLERQWAAPLAATAVVILTMLNVLGVVLGKWTQNLLTLAKVLGLLGILVAGFTWGQPGRFEAPAVAPAASFGMAMIFVLYAYGGWNDAAFVAAELRDRRNISRALILGILLITAIYVAVNAAYIQALGFEGVRDSRTVAADVLKQPLGDAASKTMTVLVMISALGAINGLIFTSSRVYASMGSDWSLFAWLGRWHPRLGTPLWALAAQCFITLAMIAVVGTEQGRQAIDRGLTQIRLQPLPWDKYDGGFDTLVAGTAPVFWIFFLLTGLSLFVLRERDPDIERPFTVPLFPLVPLIFCGTCVYMLYSALDYAGLISLLGFVPLALGLPLYWLSPRRPAAREPAEYA